MVYPTSLKAFSDMYYALTGNATALYDGKELPLTQVKNMCHDNSSEVRKKLSLPNRKPINLLRHHYHLLFHLLNNNS